MFFRHSEALWADYPELVPGVLRAGGIRDGVDVRPRVAHFNSLAQARLAAGPEGEFPEVQAWRRAFSKMGLKPTQYRCASESLLRHFEKAFGLTPLAWLQQQRAERARGLIRRGASLAQAAASCGFADQSHMTRLFTRQFGFTPGAWQKAAGLQ